IPIASMFLAVSMNVSPFDRLLPEAEKSTVSAPSRRAASEKLVRVRVEGSKNKLAQVRPVNTGSFCLQPAVASLKVAAASRMQFNSSADRSSRPNRCRRVQTAGMPPISLMSMLMRACLGPPGEVPHDSISCRPRCQSSTAANQRPPFFAEFLDRLASQLLESLLFILPVAHPLVELEDDFLVVFPDQIGQESGRDAIAAVVAGSIRIDPPDLAGLVFEESYVIGHAFHQPAGILAAAVVLHDMHGFVDHRPEIVGMFLEKPDRTDDAIAAGRCHAPVIVFERHPYQARRPEAVALELFVDHRIGPLANPGGLLRPRLHLGSIAGVDDEFDGIFEHAHDGLRLNLDL